jgi:Cu+-exporting ATPase
VELKKNYSVEGMTCSSCAEGIAKQLNKKGWQDVFVSYNDSKVEVVLHNESDDKVVRNEITKLGYTIVDNQPINAEKTDTVLVYFVVSAVLTIPLLLHMFIGWHFLQLPLVQFALSTPVVIIGMLHFGKSAWGSIKVMHPNMDVLITMGALMAYVYSIIGWLFFKDTVHNYLFFETSATIITLVLLGNLIESRSLKKTNSSIVELLSLQPQRARKIVNAFSENETLEDITVTQLKNQDLIHINEGDLVPADGVIYWGNAFIDESMITGESIPTQKTENNKVIAGTLVLSGSIKVLVEQVGHQTILSNMIELIKKSTQIKPKIQLWGDKVSEVFVPIVLVISIATFFISHFIFDIPSRIAIMNSIAVLVISCPCAMGLATPTAVSVGVGKAAKEGILIKSGEVIERLQQIDTIIFDKTGTLTKGDFKIEKITYLADELLVNYILSELEKYSSHPLATTITKHVKYTGLPLVKFKQIEEIKGIGIKAIDNDNNIYQVGSKLILKTEDQSNDSQVYVTKNNELLASVNFKDTIRENAKDVIDYFKQNGIKTVLLSGDLNSKCNNVGQELGIDEIYGEKLPHEKLEIVKNYQETRKVAMAGDGINDAPALALAWVSIAIGSGTQIAMQTSDIILLNTKDFSSIIKSHEISKSIIVTIKQNLFWALIYNVIAIPVAAFGLLSPMIGAMSMAFSDVVVIGNSLRLKFKK